MSRRTCRPPAAVLLKSLVATGLLLAAATAAAAYSTRVLQECRGDYYRFCAGLQIGSAKLVECMEASRTQLSRDCVAALVKDGDVPSRQMRSDN